MERAKEQALKNEKRTDSNVRELIFLYDEAAARTEKEISTLFARYAKDNVLTSAEAAKLLEGKEYSRWQKSIEEYIADASGAAKNSKAMLELNTLAMKSRISRKEQLLGNIYRNTMDLAGDSTTKLDSLLGDMLKVNYFEGCFNIQRELGVGFNVAKIDDKTIKSILDFAWSEKHYSEAVWGHCDHLAALTKRELTLGFIQGSSVQQMAKAIDDVMGKGRYAAERLVRTESKYFANQGELLSYKENGVKKYRFVGGGEGGSCICGALNGKIFSVDEADPGVNFPPIHPNCLCIVVAAYDHSIFEKREHAFPLQDNIKFKEWKEKYAERPPTPTGIKLSDDEEHALNSYIGSNSYKLNAKLRSGLPLSPDENRLVSSLDSALEKLPEVWDTVYRSISDVEIEDVDGFVNSYVEGTIENFSAYTSSSTSVYDDSFPIQYVIKSKHGKDLSVYNPNEGEVLFSRFTRFIITKVVGRTIFMEEE